MNSKSTDQASVLSDRDMELLSRYNDGEMSPMEARRFERRLDGEAELRLALQRVEELNHRLRDALSLQATIPGAVQSLLAARPQVEGSAGADAAAYRDRDETTGEASPGKVLLFPSQRRTGSGTPGGVSWRAALAASIAVVVAAGIVLDRQEPGSQLPGNDRLVDAALDRLPSGNGWSALADGREVQPVLTFPHRDGNWCREYLLRAQDNWRAVACHDGDRWVTQAAGLESSMEAGAAYRPAGAPDAAPVAMFIDQNAADIALGAQAEADLLSEWSSRN